MSFDYYISNTSGASRDYPTLNISTLLPDEITAGSGGIGGISTNVNNGTGNDGIDGVNGGIWVE